jgi:hypothetical protein
MDISKMDCGQCFDCRLSHDCPCRSIYYKKCEVKAGTFFDVDYYDEIITDSLIGFKENGEVLFVLVKNAIPEEKRDKYKKVIKPVAKSKTKNRGASAGPVDISKFPNKAVELVDKNGNVFTDDKERYSVYYKEASGKVVNRCQSNQTRSGVAGYFDKVAGLPCRKVGWSSKNLAKHNVLCELAQDIQAVHKEYEPNSFEFQESQSKLSPNYLFDNSIYSTMTLNYDFRTASHKDKGDLVGGLSTLTILEDLKDNYEKFYIGLPEYKIAFDLRDGDTLIFDAHEYHANTEHKVLSEKLGYDDLNDDFFAGRMSIVCYLRNKLKDCPLERSD